MESPARRRVVVVGGGPGGMEAAGVGRCAVTKYSPTSARENWAASCSSGGERLQGKARLAARGPAPATRGVGRTRGAQLRGLSFTSQRGNTRFPELLDDLAPGERPFLRPCGTECSRRVRIVFVGHRPRAATTVEPTDAAQAGTGSGAAEPLILVHAASSWDWERIAGSPSILACA